MHQTKYKVHIVKKNGGYNGNNVTPNRYRMLYHNGSCEVSLTELTRLKKFRGDTNADKDSSVCPQLKQKTG